MRRLKTGLGGVLGERAHSDGAASSAVSVSVSVPRAAKRTTAPLAIHRTDSSLRKDYAVTLRDGPGPAADVTLRTTDGDVKAALYLLGRLDRPARIAVRTTHGSVRLALHREPGQAVDVHAETTGGRVRIWLPAQFAGVVAGRTTRSGVTLSPALDASASPLPPPPPGPTSQSKETAKAWAISPRPGTSPGPDRVRAQTKHAGVRFFACGEKDTEDDEVWDIVEEVVGTAVDV